MLYKLGFIGCGNMATAIMEGALKAGFLKPEELLLYDIDAPKLHQRAQQTGAQRADSLAGLVRGAQVLLMAVKPGAVEPVIEEARELLPGKALLSIAVGWDFERYQRALPPGARVAYIMPNTPCMVGEGMALIEETNSLSPAELDFAKGLFGSIGRVEVMKSALMGVAGTLSGCGPAFVYMFIEALADGAVYHGLPRDTAYRLASQMVLGAGKMVQGTSTHPGALKDNVCSPGGTTIRGVRALEDGAFRAALIDAIDRAVNA